MAELLLSETEIEERTAILRRLRQLLEQQRTKFREYLEVLEKQETSIRDENVSALTAQAELEQQIVFNISNLQRVIKPMEDLYRSVYHGEEDYIPKIQADLTHIQEQVLEQNRKNRELLKSNIVMIRNKLAQMKNPYAGNQSIYASQMNTATLVDIMQ
jgi:hypothetical protein